MLLLRAVHIGSTDVAVTNAPDMVNVDENSVPYLDKVHCTCSPCRDMVSVLFSQCGCVVFYLHFGEIRGKPLPPSNCCPLCRSHAKIYATSRSPQADLSLQLDGAPSSMHVRCF